MAGQLVETFHLFSPPLISGLILTHASFHTFLPTISSIRQFPLLSFIEIKYIYEKADAVQQMLK